MHNPEFARKILLTLLKNGNGRRKISQIRHDEENACRFEVYRKKHGSTRDLHVNSCQGMDAGVLFILNYSIHQHTGIGCDTSS